MIKRFSAVTFEGFLFYACLGVSLLTVILNKTNPTIDGPAHLYNARLINYLIGGNEFIGKYYILNKVPVPNLTDHYLLVLFMSIFKWQVAEKLFFVLYLAGFSLLFRSLVRQWNLENNGLSVFAVPFSFTYLYYVGFYNFSLSFPLLFGIILYHRKHFSCEGKPPFLRHYLVVCILATLIYFTNGLTFLYAGLSLFLFELPIWARFFSDRQNTGNRILIKRILSFFMVWVPGVVCFLLFFYLVHFNSGTRRIPLPDLMLWIYHLEPLVLYSSFENGITRYLFYFICIVLLTVVYFKIKNKRLFKFNSAGVFLILSIFSFFCFLIEPDDASVGMMSMRFCYYFFIFLLLWIAMQPGSKIFTGIVAVAIVTIHFMLFFEKHQPVTSDLSNEAERVADAGKAIKPNSVVLGIDVTGNWVLPHFSDYLGMDKPLIIINNYEPDCGWFAVNWNYHTMPKLFVGDNNEFPSYIAKHWVLSDETKMFDYIFIHGDYNDFLQKADWKTLNGYLQKNYKLTYASANNHIHIFSLKGN